MNEERGDNTIRLSVRGLVEWVEREGDIDNRRIGPSDETAMLLGANVHRKLQKQESGTYKAEVPLSFDFPLERPENDPRPDGVLSLSGRADGVICEEENGKTRVTVDEIKGVFQDVLSMEGPKKVHLAQAECYAAILAKTESLSGISVRMTYVRLTEEEKGKKAHPDEIKRFTYRYTFDEIWEKTMSYVNAYRKWAFFTIDHRLERNESAAGLAFPYEFRPGQKEIVSRCYVAMRDRRRLFVQAPTGIGKTLGVLFPAVKSVGNGNGEKIFYLTAKTVTGNAAEDGMKVLEKSGLRFSFVKITAKEKLCPLDGKSCDPVRCARANGHFSRVNDAIYDVITHENAIGTDTVVSYAEKHAVCPYEFVLDVSLFTDVIICDYNYAFDPRVYLRRYFEEPSGEEIFLIDEAHNLIDRAREMYSAALVKEEVLAAKKTFQRGKSVVKRLEKLNRILLELKRECETTVVYGDDRFPNALIEPARTLAAEISEYLDKNRSSDETEALDFYFRLRRFLDMFDAMDEGYLPYASYDESGRFFVRLMCADPSGQLKARLERIRSAIFFSATLLPVNYYKRMLTGSETEDAFYCNSPFDPSKRMLLLARDVSTKYTRRNETEYRRIASYLLAFAQGHAGNYLAFFPSHKFLEDTEAILLENADENAVVPADPSGTVREIEIVSQKKAMTEEERNAFLSRFTDENTPDGRSLLALSVMGGVFSEGIDLKGEALIGVAVVGTGIPMVTKERDLMKERLEETGVSGFDYAYRFPGFNKVLQAAGRLIRTPDDKGVILLMDERFLYRENKALFPREWADYRVTDLKNVGWEIESFWESGRSVETND